MAQKRNTTKRPKSKRRVTYFYVNKELHKVLRVVKAMDSVEAWNYVQHRSVLYSWSDTQKRMEQAFPMSVVSEMIGRDRVTLQNYILCGQIKAPQRIYVLDGTDRPGKYFFSESDVLDLHDFLMTIHIGKPRMDGKTTPMAMPTKSELRAMMRHDTVSYIKGRDGNFVPVWKEVDW